MPGSTDSSHRGDQQLSPSHTHPLDAMETQPLNLGTLTIGGSCLNLSLSPLQQLPLHTNNARVLYVTSRRLAAIGQRAHFNQDRAILLHALLSATGLLSDMDVEEARPATIEELRQYHASVDYLSALANYHLFSPRQLAVYGLEDDCAPFPEMFEYACICAGGSLQAAAALAEGRCRAAIHLEGGGRHHARKARASGFCYVNDVILAILRLLSTFKRVMYIDIDVHHGDAVEEAFYSSDRVLTVSLHHASPGYFPGSGAFGAGGQGAGAGFALNLPLKEGLKDELFTQAFTSLCREAVQLYRPDCIVLQCGVDGLAHDPVGRAWALTPGAYGQVVAEAAGWGIPLIMLGGGGYSAAAASCAWTTAVAALMGQELPSDVPDHAFLDRYGPNYSISAPGRPSLQRDHNTAAEVGQACDGLLRMLGEAVDRRKSEVSVVKAREGGGMQANGQRGGVGGGKRLRVDDGETVALRGVAVSQGT